MAPARGGKTLRLGGVGTFGRPILGAGTADPLDPASRRATIRPGATGSVIQAAWGVVQVVRRNIMATVGIAATRWDDTGGSRGSRRKDLGMWFLIIAGIFVVVLVGGAWLWDRRHGTSGTRIEIADRRPDSDRPGVG